MGIHFYNKCVYENRTKFEEYLHFCRKTSPRRYLAKTQNIIILYYLRIISFMIFFPSVVSGFIINVFGAQRNITWTYFHLEKRAEYETYVSVNQIYFR